MIFSKILWGCERINLLSKIGISGTYLALPSKNNIRYLVELKENKPNKFWLKMFEPYSINGKVFKFFSHFLFNIFPKILSNNIIFLESRNEKNILDYIYRILNLDKKNIIKNIYISTLGFDKKIVIQIVSLKNEKTFYIKITDKNFSYLLENEYNSINLFKKAQFNHLKIPNIVYYDSKQNFLILESFDGKKVKPMINKNIILVYNEISSKNKETFDIKFYLEKRIKNIISLNNENSKIIYDLAYKINKNFKNKQIKVSYSHGDFAPWNLRECERNLFYVFDWEYFDLRFEGYDIIHYLYQIQTLLKKKNFVIALLESIQKTINYKIINEDIELLKNLYLFERLITFQNTEDIDFILSEGLN